MQWIASVGLSVPVACIYYAPPQPQVWRIGWRSKPQSDPHCTSQVIWFGPSLCKLASFRGSPWLLHYYNSDGMHSIEIQPGISLRVVSCVAATYTSQLMGVVTSLIHSLSFQSMCIFRYNISCIQFARRIVPTPHHSIHTGGPWFIDSHSTAFPHTSSMQPRTASWAVCGAEWVNLSGNVN